MAKRATSKKKKPAASTKRAPKAKRKAAPKARAKTSGRKVAAASKASSSRKTEALLAQVIGRLDNLLEGLAAIHQEVVRDVVTSESDAPRKFGSGGERPSEMQAS